MVISPSHSLFVYITLSSHANANSLFSLSLGWWTVYFSSQPSLIVLDFIPSIHFTFSLGFTSSTNTHERATRWLCCTSQKSFSYFPSVHHMKTTTRSILTTVEAGHDDDNNNDDDRHDASRRREKTCWYDTRLDMFSWWAENGHLINTHTHLPPYLVSENVAVVFKFPKHETPINLD